MLEEHPDVEVQAPTRGNEPRTDERPALGPRGLEHLPSRRPVDPFHGERDRDRLARIVQHDHRLPPRPPRRQLADPTERHREGLPFLEASPIHRHDLEPSGAPLFELRVTAREAQRQRWPQAPDPPHPPLQEPPHRAERRAPRPRPARPIRPIRPHPPPPAAHLAPRAGPCGAPRSLLESKKRDPVISNGCGRSGCPTVSHGVPSRPPSRL